MSWIQEHVLQWAIAALPIGALTLVIGQYIKKLSDTVDQTATGTKRFVIIPIIAAVVTAIGAKLGVPIVCAPDTNCLTALNGSTLDALVKAGLGYLVALIAHAGKDGNTSGTTTASPDPTPKP